LSDIRQILREIHRRSLWQTFAFYIVISVVVYEVSSSIAVRRGLPDWFMLLSLILLIVGLPIVMITAVLQEGIPRIGRSDPQLRIDLSEDVVQRAHPTGLRRLFTWRNAILGGVAAFTLWAVVAAGWLVLADQLVQDTRGTPEPTVETGQ
jgi:hypothetical protein